MSSNSFALDLRRYVDKYKDDMDKVARTAVIDVGARLIEASPVGDPSKWKLPDSAPPGYVGGTFKNSWDMSVEATPTAIYDKPDKTGADSTARIDAAVPGQAAGPVYFIANTQPYAVRLEEGWSHQSPPNAMVGLTVLAWQQIVDAAVGKVKEGSS